MENIDPNILQNFLQNNSDSGLTPTINIFPEQLVTAFMTVMYVLTFLSVLFLIAYIISTIRKWKVQSAILDMQKDIKVIKNSLAKETPTSNRAPVDTDTSKIA